MMGDLWVEVEERIEIIIFEEGEELYDEDFGLCVMKFFLVGKVRFWK